MGINKVQYGNTTLIDLTSDTVTADKLMQGYTAHDRTGALITGTATGSGSGAVWQDSQGYVHLSDEGDIELQTKSVTPSETAQTVTPDAGYYALNKVNVGAISSTYVGSGITRRSSSDLTASGATITVPSGYYSAQASKAVTTGTAGTPTATKGTVSNHAISVTPKVTNTTGYITGSTKTGTAVTVSASELVSGTKSITENGTGIDVSNYANVDVNVSSGSNISTVQVTVYTSLSDMIVGPIYNEENEGCGFSLNTGSWSADGFTFDVLCNPNFTQTGGNMIQYVSTSSTRAITPDNNIEMGSTFTLGNCTFYVLYIMGDNASFTVA